MKLWFVEARPNVFVSGIKDSVAKTVIDYLMEKCPPESGLMMFLRISSPPGYRIYGYGSPARELVEISGLQLIMEKTCAANALPGQSGA